MINPLRSEAEAFRFVLASLAYFAAIVIAAVVGGRWVGLAVFIALTVLVAWWIFFRGQREAPIRQARQSPHTARQLSTTKSPGATSVTSGPTASTTPADSCPSTAGA